MKIKKDFRLSEVLWYKIGGICRYLLDCESSEDILNALEFIEKNHVKKFLVVGLGSNLLFTDEYYDGAVIRIVSSENKHDISQVGNNIVEAFAGVTLDNVIRFAFENKLVGLEWAGGLPGTIGAAIRGNVGAFGGEIKDSFHHAEAIRIVALKSSVGEGVGLKVESFNRRDIKFSYRTSTVKLNKNLIVISVAFQLRKATDEELAKARQTYFGNIEYRNKRHPMDLPSNGSAFKNIVKLEEVQKILDVYPDIEEKIRIDWHGKVSVGYLIKRLDLSGFQIGGAQISRKHSNFIVNTGGARFTDVIGIIRKVQTIFEETFGFAPEPEVEIVE